MATAMKGAARVERGVSAARKASNLTAGIFIALGTLIVVAPLILIFVYLITQGIGALSLHFFTRTPAPEGETGGGWRTFGLLHWTPRSFARPHAPERSLIDWDLTVFIPALLVGVSVGKLLAQWTGFVDGCLSWLPYKIWPMTSAHHMAGASLIHMHA